MKFWAKVRFKSEKNAQSLIRAFFKDFTSESSIVIRGKEANVEIIFDKPPMEIIKTISHCDIMEFIFGKTLDEYEDETEQVVTEEDISKQTRQVVAEKDSLKQTEQVVAKEINPEKSEILNKNKYRIPELSELADQCDSYEEFIKSVVSWLQMDKKEDFFENLIKAAEQAKTITWNNIEEILKNDGIIYRKCDQLWCTKKVAEKFKNSKTSVTIMKLIKVIVEYKTYNFNHEVESKTEKLTEETAEQVEVNNAEIGEPRNRIKMDCMPEIPHFEEILGNVDKTQPIEERVKYVLTAMGWNKINAKEQQEIFEITNMAVRLRSLDFDSIFLKAKIPMEDSMSARMTFSKFINDFTKEYDSNKKVKLLDFLKELQNIVMSESEIENFSNVSE